MRPVGRVLASAPLRMLALLAVVLAAAEARAIYVCGPGAHWVDGCPAGADFFPTSGALVGIDTNLDGFVDVSLVMYGPTTVQRQAASDDSVNFPGTRPVDAHLDVIDTEIVSLDLHSGAAHLPIGLWAGQGLSPHSGVALNPSFGAIFEQGGNPFLADSFFDVFFEVDLGGGIFAYNHAPLNIQTINIAGVPPYPQTYVHPVGLVPLFTAPIGGIQIANLVSAIHITPEPGTVVLLGVGLAGLAARRRRMR